MHLTEGMAMKTRSGFVSNSSSSSFIISRDNLNNLQIAMIKHHIAISKEIYSEGEIDNDPSDAWSVFDDGENIKLYTTMDNFDMWHFLVRIGVKEEHIVSNK